jgi:hypothetical protein
LVRSVIQCSVELNLLKELYRTVPPASTFGDDNRAAIRAQTNVLTKRLTLDEVLAQYGEEPEYTLSAALSAVEWLYEGGPAASDGWTLAHAA